MYASNLAQKARELKREKRKSDTLLFQMLPPSVAQQLKQTQQVEMRMHVNRIIIFMLYSMANRNSFLGAS